MTWKHSGLISYLSYITVQWQRLIKSTSTWPLMQGTNWKECCCFFPPSLQNSEMCLYWTNLTSGRKDTDLLWPVTWVLISITTILYSDNKHNYLLTLLDSIWPFDSVSVNSAKALFTAHLSSCLTFLIVLTRWVSLLSSLMWKDFRLSSNNMIETDCV